MVDDDLRTQEQILAELKKLRGEKSGWTVERQGLEGQIKTLERQVSIETERGDFFKTAAEKAQQIDKNSQKMDVNSTMIQTQLERQVADKNQRIAELTDDLRSCQNNQKWIFGAGTVAGGIGGWLLKGQTDRFLGNGSLVARPTFSIPASVMPNPLKPAREFLKLGGN